jgi:hypothetical protein
LGIEIYLVVSVLSCGHQKEIVGISATSRQAIRAEKNYFFHDINFKLLFGDYTCDPLFSNMIFTHFDRSIVGLLNNNNKTTVSKIFKKIIQFIKKR